MLLSPRDAGHDGGVPFVFCSIGSSSALMITAVLYNLAISAFVFLLPVVAKELLQVGPMELGWWSALESACWRVYLAGQNPRRARSKIGSVRSGDR